MTITIKTFSPLFSVVASVGATAIFSAVWAARFVLDTPGGMTGETGIGMVLTPVFFMGTWLLLEFLILSPIMTIALLACAFIASSRRSESKWAWIASCAIWVVCLIPFYFSLRIYLDSPALRNFHPF